MQGHTDNKAYHVLSIYNIDSHRSSVIMVGWGLTAWQSFKGEVSNQGRMGLGVPFIDHIAYKFSKCPPRRILLVSLGNTPYNGVYGEVPAETDVFFML